MHDIVRMDVLMMGVYTSVNTTVYIFPSGETAEAVFMMDWLYNVMPY